MAAGLLGCACLLAACQPARPAKTAVIAIDQLAFGSAPADLHVGDTVEWVNHDMFEHTATAKDGQFDVDLQPGASGEVVLKRSGSVGYYCRFHPGMTGQITVSP